MPNIFTTARYILKKSGKMVQYTLHILCYYSQGWSLACNGEELFPEEFEAWVHGPACVELFDFFRSKKNIDLFAIGYRNIPKARCVGELTEGQRKLIDNVLKVYLPFTDCQLERTVHTEDPYKKARVGLNPWEHCEKVISKEEMKVFFRSMQGEEEELPVGAEVTD